MRVGYRVFVAHSVNERLAVSFGGRANVVTVGAPHDPLQDNALPGRRRGTVPDNDVGDLNPEQRRENMKTGATVRFSRGSFVHSHSKNSWSCWLHRTIVLAAFIQPLAFNSVHRQAQAPPCSPKGVHIVGSIDETTWA